MRQVPQFIFTFAKGWASFKTYLVLQLAANKQ